MSSVSDVLNNSCGFRLRNFTAVLRCFDSSSRSVFRLFFAQVWLHAIFVTIHSNSVQSVRQSPRLRVLCPSQLVCLKASGEWGKSHGCEGRLDSLMLCEITPNQARKHVKNACSLWSLSCPFLQNLSVAPSLACTMITMLLLAVSSKKKVTFHESSLTGL